MQSAHCWSNGPWQDSAVTPCRPPLQQFAELGCPVDISKDWTLEALVKAVEYGAHPSARTKEAAMACHQEALEKVEQGFIKLVPWRIL